MSEPVLVVEDLHVRYGSEMVVKGLSLSVAPGECLAITGPNGCGKTTLLRAISGHVMPCKGKVTFCGQDITHLPAWRRAQMGLVHVLEGGRVFPSLTVDENIRAASACNGKKAADAVTAVYKLFPQLNEKTMRERPASVLSGGERTLVVLARAAVVQPKILLLDSPFLGVAAVLREVVRRQVKRWLADSEAVLLVHHDATPMADLASRTLPMR